MIVCLTLMCACLSPLAGTDSKQLNLAVRACVYVCVCVCVLCVAVVEVEALSGTAATL